VNPQVQRLGIPALLVLHLLPGVIATLIFVVLAAPIEAAGYPPLAAFLVAIAAGIVPFELGAVVLAGRQVAGSTELLAAVPYRRRIRGRNWLILFPALLLAAVVGFGVFALLEAPIREGIFAWLPDWFVAPVPLDGITDYSASAWIVTLAAFGVLNAIVGPVVEELYFRGFLLPRMSQFGQWAPLINVVLFSLYHLWSPWQFLSRVAGVSPFAYAVWRTQNVWLGVAVHIALNTISVATVVGLVVSQFG
jgi:membrane protease YdiL (CAAX protease family)